MIPAGATPLDIPEGMDIVTLAGVDTPGKAELSGFKRIAKWDVKMGWGTAGATETYIGKPPAQGAIKFWAWTKSHFAEWNRILPLLRYDPTKQPSKRAIQIYHPFLADLDISAVVVEEIGQWEHEGGQLYSRSIAFLEYIPPKPALATPAGADPSFQVGQPDPAIVALQQERNGAIADAQRAYGGL